MRKDALTIKDIAKEFNLSTSTISRALRDDPTIGASTREKIKKYAHDHNYQPNAMAAGLRTKKSNVIGVILPQISNPFFASILDGMEKAAEENNYTIIISQSNEDVEKEKKNITSLLNARVSGILVSLSKSTVDYTHFEDVIRKHIPLVFFDRICTGLLTDKVVVDDYQGAFQAVEYLIRTGCKRIAFFGSTPHLEITKNRKNGYLDALRKYHIRFDPELVYECDNWEDAKELTPRVLNGANPPDAIFVINDQAASGVLHAAKKAGKNVPEDLSIITFADGYVAKNSDAMLTTIDQDGKEIGKQAMELLLSRIQEEENIRKENSSDFGSERSVRNKVVKTSFSPRETTRPISVITN